MSTPYDKEVCRTLTFDDALLDEDLLEDLHAALNLLFAVCSHQREANQSILWCACRWDNRIDEDTTVEGELRHQEGLVAVADIERNDWALGLSNLEAFLAEAFQCIVRHVPQMLETPGLFLDDMKCLNGSGCCSRRVTGGEDVGAGGVTQVVDGIPVRGNKATDRRQALGEGAHDHIDVVLKAKVMANATTLLTKDTKAMSLVNHNRAIVLVLQFHDLGQLGQIAFHGEDTIDDDQLHSLVWQLLQYALQVLHIVVLVMQLSGKTQSTSIHDGSVIAVIADDIVATTHQLGNDARIDRETGGEAKSSVFVFKLSQLFLQLYVNVECAVEETTAGATGTILQQRFFGSGNDAVIACQTCIGIAAKHEHLMAAHGHLRALLARNFTEIRIYAFLHVLLWYTVVLVSFL